MSQVQHCDFCWRRCRIPPGETGYCGIRYNDHGALQTRGYGSILPPALDPIEKKPFYHVLPGTQAFSIAQLGCNFRCEFCQNYRISQKPFITDQAFRALEQYTPQEVVSRALASPCKSLAFTYSEPTVWQDFMIDCASLAKEAGLRTLMVTNGAFTTQALERIAPVMDAINIDLKGDSRVYRQLCQADDGPVRDRIKDILKAGEAGPFLEVTTLVIPDWVTPGVLESLYDFLGEAGAPVWHLTHFVPRYRSRVTHTNDYGSYQELLKTFQAQGRVPYVYGDFTASDNPSVTSCPDCGRVLIRRTGFHLRELHLDKGCCAFCGAAIPGIF